METEFKPGLVLPEVTLLHHHPAQARLSTLPWDAGGNSTQAVRDSQGQQAGTPDCVSVASRGVSALRGHGGLPGAVQAHV